MKRRRGRPSENDVVGTDDGFERLASAIILQAVQDYRNGRTRPRGVGYYAWEKNFDSAKAFFESKWFERLTNLDAKTLLRMLNEEVGKPLKIQKR